MCGVFLQLTYAGLIFLLIKYQTAADLRLLVALRQKTGQPAAVRRKAPEKLPPEQAILRTFAERAPEALIS